MTPRHPTKLSGQQVEQLHTALLSAFPDADSLAAMVRIELEEYLDQIAGGDDLSAVIFNLIRWAESRGRVADLVDGAREQNSGNPELNQLWQDSRTWAVLKPPQATPAAAPAGAQPGADTAGQTPVARDPAVAPAPRIIAFRPQTIAALVVLLLAVAVVAGVITASSWLPRTPPAGAPSPEPSPTATTGATPTATASPTTEATATTTPRATPVGGAESQLERQMAAGDRSPVEDDAGAEVVNSKLWKPGQTIRIRFLDGDPEVQQKVIDVAQQWAEYANIHFDFGNYTDATVRISFEQPGSWSFIGTDNLKVPQGQPTMNFGWLTTNTSQTEYARVVLHEFGHMLGLVKEHQQPNADIAWDREVIYDNFEGAPNYWTKEQVDANFFNKYPAGIYPVDKEFDLDSIMMYAIPNEYTTDDFEVGLNTSLSDYDKEFIGLLYPSGPEAKVPVTWFGTIAPDVTAIAGYAPEENWGYETKVENVVRGAFSVNFLGAMWDSAADIDEDGLVTLEEAVNKAWNELRRQRFEQRPFIVGLNPDLALFTLADRNTVTGTAPSLDRLHVVLVGISEYPDRRLGGPVNDVAEFSRMLAEEGRVDARVVQVDTLTDAEATRANILSSVEELVAGADSRTTIVFYFSGMTGSTPQEQNTTTAQPKVLLPHDYLDDANRISAYDIAAMLAESDARYKVMIVDG